MKRQLPQHVLDKLREQSSQTLDKMRGPVGNYAVRLAKVHDRALLHGDLVRSASTLATWALVRGRKHRVKERLLQIALRTMYLPATHGNVVAFSHSTVGLSRDKRPIIDPVVQADSAFTIAHVPWDVGTASGETHNLARMKVDMAFTVDSDDNVTIDGRNAATAGEYALFDDLVSEFESRVALSSDSQMWAAYHAKRDR